MNKSYIFSILGNKFAMWCLFDQGQHHRRDSRHWVARSCCDSRLRVYTILLMKFWWPYDTNISLWLHHPANYIIISRCKSRYIFIWRDALILCEEVSMRRLLHISMCRGAWTFELTDIWSLHIIYDVWMVIALTWVCCSMLGPII